MARLDDGSYVMMGKPNASAVAIWPAPVMAAAPAFSPITGPPGSIACRVPVSETYGPPGSIRWYATADQVMSIFGQTYTVLLAFANLTVATM